MHPQHTPAHPRAHRLTRAVATGAAAVALVVVPVTAAFAHVPVTPGSSAAGATTTLTFRVPNESDSAATTAVTLTMPTATPLIAVSARPVAGWTVSVVEAPLPTPAVVDGTTITKAPATITWTATDPAAAIGQHQFQEFEISAGPLPAAGTALVFPTTQTYSDGTVVHWDQVQTGATEPEHPAPAFTVTPAVDTTAATTGSAGSGSAASDGTARALAGSGLVLGVAALLLAAGALLRRRPTAGAAR